MAYLILIIGLILFIYGFKKSHIAYEDDFKDIYEQASDQSEVKLVNHTIREDELQQDVAFLKKEVETLKKYMTGRAFQSSEIPSSERDNEKGPQKQEEMQNAHSKKEKSPKHKEKEEDLSYEALYQKLRDSESDLSLDALSKEMEIGKGELLLLKKLSKK